jgi:hypothetical protein
MDDFIKPVYRGKASFNWGENLDMRIFPGHAGGSDGMPEEKKFALCVCLRSCAT